MVDMVWLGAGASVEAGVPSAYDMAKETVKEFEEEPHCRMQALL